jgi:hypothetical protein
MFLVRNPFSKSLLQAKLKVEELMYQPPEIVKREYRNNYIAVGMVIGYAIIAGASVIAFAFTIRDKIVPAD